MLLYLGDQGDILTQPLPVLVGRKRSLLSCVGGEGEVCTPHPSFSSEGTCQRVSGQPSWLGDLSRPEASQSTLEDFLLFLAFLLELSVLWVASTGCCLPLPVVAVFAQLWLLVTTASTGCSQHWLFGMGSRGGFPLALSSRPLPINLLWAGPGLLSLGDEQSW